MKKLLILTAAVLLLAAPGCRGMRGHGCQCGIAEPVCGQPAIYDGGTYLPPASTIPTLPGPVETLPPTITN
jgi:hypothetical protein